MDLPPLGRERVARSKTLSVVPVFNVAGNITTAFMIAVLIE